MKIRPCDWENRDRAVAALERALAKAETMKAQGSIQGARAVQDLAHLEHLLEFSFSWKNVASIEFFAPQASTGLEDYLKGSGIEHLDDFLKVPRERVANHLRTFGVDYPLALQKLQKQLDGNHIAA